MKRVQVKELLMQAINQDYAIPAINAANFEEIDSVFKASSKLEAPIIIQLAKIQIDCLEVSIETYIKMVEAIASNYEKGVYAIHLDHCDDLSFCKKAYQAGLDSIMYDGSELSFKDNLRMSIEARQINREITLEAELGSFGEEGSNNNKVGDFIAKEDVKLFVESTNVNMIALAFGNAHGFYKGVPKLDFAYLKEVSAMINIPIVLHGATGISKEDIQHAIILGIKKVNFFTTVNHQYKAYIETNIKDTGMMIKLMQGAKQVMVKEIEICIDYCNARKRT